MHGELTPQYFEDRTRADLRARRWLRVHVAFIGALTFALCWALSHALWRAGVETLWLRHALALGGAYLGYLGLLWLWARWLLSREEADASPDLGGGGGRGGSKAEPPKHFESGEGGDFGGGGAGGTWDAAGEALGSVGEAAGAALDEAAIVLVPLAVVIGAALLLAAGLGVTVVGLFGVEVLLGVAVEIAFAAAGGALALKARREGWLPCALRRTWKPMLAVLGIGVALGLAIEAWLPGASTLPQALRRIF